mgnify:CR=1 FL=1
MNDLEQIAIQALAEEAGVDVKTYPVHDELILVDDDYKAGVHIRYSNPQQVRARVGRGSSTKKKLDPESVRVAVCMAKKIDETLARAATLIREDGRFTLVDGSPHNSIWLRRSNDPSGARFKVQVAFHRSSLAVSGSAPQDDPLAREVESILQVR